MHQPSIFITGAAAGIGKATALRFLAGGWQVGAFDIDAQGLESLANAAAAMGCLELLITGQLDVTNNDSWLSRNNQLDIRRGLQQRRQRFSFAI